jgi:hypothetical protein
MSYFQGQNSGLLAPHDEHLKNLPQLGFAA